MTVSSSSSSTLPDLRFPQFHGQFHGRISTVNEVSDRQACKKRDSTPRNPIQGDNRRKHTPNSYRLTPFDATPFWPPLTGFRTKLPSGFSLHLTLRGNQGVNLRECPKGIFELLEESSPRYPKAFEGARANEFSELSRKGINGSRGRRGGGWGDISAA